MVRYVKMGSKEVLLEAIEKHRLVSEAFLWNTTEEGHNYWHRVMKNGHTPESIEKLKKMYIEYSVCGSVEWEHESPRYPGRA